MILKNWCIANIESPLYIKQKKKKKIMPQHEEENKNKNKKIMPQHDRSKAVRLDRTPCASSNATAAQQLKKRGLSKHQRCRNQKVKSRAKARPPEGDPHDKHQRSQQQSQFF